MIVILIKRTESESEFDFHKRLITEKVVDKEMADVDYSELSELVYGRSLSSDSTRKMMYGSAYTLELFEDEMRKAIEACESGSGSDVCDEIDKKIIELKKERQRFFDQRREYNKEISYAGRMEHLYDALERAAEGLNGTVGKLFTYDMSHATQYADNDAVLVLSDWHYGMTTDNVFNRYNTKICRERVANLVDQTVRRLMVHNCANLHIVVLGDLFHGAIHTSARVASEELVCDQIMQVSEILAQAITELSRYVQHTDVYMTYGNHARTVQSKQDSIHGDNLERLIPWWLEHRMAGNDSVVVHRCDDNEFLFVDVRGHEFVATHGDLDSVRTSLPTLATLAQKQFGKNIEYILLGDKHHRESFEGIGVTAMLCGSLCGTDDYANDKRLYSTPSQMLMIVNEAFGVDAEYRIKC